MQGSPREATSSPSTIFARNLAEWPGLARLLVAFVPAVALIHAARLPFLELNRYYGWLSEGAAALVAGNAAPITALVLVLLILRRLPDHLLRISNTGVQAPAGYLDFTKALAVTRKQILVVRLRWSPLALGGLYRHSGNAAWSMSILRFFGFVSAYYLFEAITIETAQRELTFASRVPQSHQWNAVDLFEVLPDRELLYREEYHAPLLPFVYLLSRKDRQRMELGLKNASAPPAVALSGGNAP